jgi:two-component system sensor histidine kinase PilS (NtrC family)
LVASARLAALSQSAATLAHELRNPLGAIINSAGLLRSDRGMEADNRKLMEIIVAEGQRLDRAVSKFLGLVRRPRSRPAAVDLAKLVRDVVALARHDRAFDGANIRLESALRSGVPHVHADPDELQQVVWNLLRNAAQATERAGGSSVTITVRCEAETVVLELADEGPGPPEPHKDGEPPPHGTGLGLIVVAGVVAQNGGRFELVPRIDRQGAVARVILPIPAVREES